MFEWVSSLDIPDALVIDLMVLSICGVLLWRYGQLAHSHPAITYLLFHILIVPTRLFAILAGAETLYSNWGLVFEPVTETEIVRAAFLADVTLVIMTIAWIRAAVVESHLRVDQVSKASEQPVTLSPRHIQKVALIAFPIGVIVLALLANVPGIERSELDLGGWQESSYLLISMTWAGLALLGLIYWYGFKWWLMTPMAFYLLLMAVQGYHRFRVIIPLLLLLQIYLDRREKKWPPAIVLAGLVVGLLVFFPMKTIGRMAQEGASITEISESSSTIIREALSGQAADQSVLDQLASSLTLIDREDKFYYGKTYLALLTAPVPRQWWPDKPTLNEHMQEFSTPSRPMAEMGMITTVIGEFYVNFGYVGIIIMSYLTAYWLARVYFKAYRSNYFSVLRFSYLLIACNLIQVYRDGLISIAVFTLVNMMPLAIIVFLHYILPTSPREQKRNITVPRLAR